MMDRFEDGLDVNKIKAQFYHKKSITRAIEEVSIEVLKDAHVSKVKSTKTSGTGKLSSTSTSSNGSNGGGGGFGGY